MKCRLIIVGATVALLSLLAACTAGSAPRSAAPAAPPAPPSEAGGQPSPTVPTPPLAAPAPPATPTAAAAILLPATPTAAAILLPATPTAAAASSSRAERAAPTLTPTAAPSLTPAPVSAAVTPVASPAAPTEQPPVPVSAPLPPPAGFRIRIPAVGIDAPIVSVGLEPDGSMAAPDGPDIVGWYAPGARPGGQGNALLDGHVDWSDRQTGVARTAVFYPMKDVRNGQDIVIDADGRRHVYKVRETLVFAWDDPSALRVLQPSSESLVTLITCEGSFDRSARNYSHRRVVIAALAASE